jgi:murein DD-endopeptidase MepM/ murein hydrolase activator NlpD
MNEPPSLKYEGRRRKYHVRRARRACLAFGLAAACAAPPVPPAPRTADIPLAKDSDRLAGSVPPGATFADLLESHGASAASAAGITAAVEPVFSSRRMRAHQPYEIERRRDGFVRELIYRVDADRYLRAFAAAPGEPYAVETAAYRKERGLVAIRGEIDRERTSLVAAVAAAGEDVSLAIAIADLFSGDIDFNHDLQPGDGFEVVFEQVLREGTRAGYGDVVAATFRNGDKTYSAFRYQPPGGKPAYYDAAGRSIHRFFLASPLKFEPRVTSRFSYRRLHPVLGIRRPHLGVDVGAPRGAPVVATADGTVVAARYMGGGGNTVVLRHAAGYESRYLHLSAFGKGLRAGARVQQGQLVGRVGSTGLSTGAHLHYELKRNGTHVNPVAEHKRHPPGEPIPPAHRDAFEEARAGLAARFVSALPADSVSP